MVDSLEIVGIAILIGFLTGKFIGNYKIGGYKIPAVAGYVIIGVVFGQSVFNVFQKPMLDKLGVISELAVGFIAFKIGGELKWGNLKKLSKSLFPIVILESLGAMVLVTASVQLLFHQWSLSLILGAISAATAPAATVAVIQESRAKGNFTNTLLAVVAIDDAIALIVYGIASAISKALLSSNEVFSITSIMEGSLFEIGGAFLVGISAGFLLGPWVKKMRSRDAIFSVMTGTVLLIIGLANHFHLSSLLANMTFGVIVTNIAPISSKKVFEQVSMVTPPLFIAFFVIAGAHLRIDLLPSLGLVGLVYLLARMIGKISGASLGASMVNAPDDVKKYIGFGLLSQVGIAIGLSLVVAKEFSPLGDAGRELAIKVINILLATTVITEIIGPVLTKYALVKSGDAGKLKKSRRL